MGCLANHLVRFFLVRFVLMCRQCEQMCEITKVTYFGALEASLCAGRFREQGTSASDMDTLGISHCMWHNLAVYPKFARSFKRSKADRDGSSCSREARPRSRSARSEFSRKNGNVVSLTPAA